MYNPNCPYCGKKTLYPNGILLPSRDLRTRAAWHNTCVSRFLWEHRDKCDLDTVLDNGKDPLHEDDDFIELIRKVNEAERRYNYKKIILTV